MKYLILFLLPFAALSQQDFKSYLVTCPMMFAAGAAEGTRETITTRYWNFKKKFPNANDEYWNPDISWKNKWKNGDPTQGPAYFGSTTFLAWTTDGKHLLSTMRNGITVAAVVYIPIHGRKKKWYWYVMDAVVNLAAFQIGFHTTHTLLFNNQNL